MTRTQLAATRSTFVIGAIALIAGVILFVIDHTTTDQICTSGYVSVCRDVPPSNRGAWLAGVAALILIGTAIAWSTLTPERSADAPTPSASRSGRPLAIAIGVLFTVVVIAALIDVLSG
ncbi:hypothetical protein [Nocardia africana]|uniref:Transmembrane protein n=1 Tax=Nocardia africana TaxID=134964 RepID=A0A378X0U4_9NOCA|nr:hypothetical protein [Nocardia africana]MCC3311510.1 hypothetical protein [Nocardia africana]SUA47226.1 Uncharacterised protein [Nocardia africana]